MLFKKQKISLFIVLFSMMQFSYAQNQWDGDNAVGNFNNCDNWYSNACPSTWNSSTDLIFEQKVNGSQSSLYQNIGWRSVRSIIYNTTFPFGIPFDGDGSSGFDFWFKIENLSAHPQVINIPTSGKGLVMELNPINDDLTFNNTIFNDNNIDYEVYGDNGNKLTLNSHLVGNGSVSLTLKQYSIVEVNYNNAASLSGGFFVDEGELWVNSNGVIQGNIQIGNGTGNFNKLYISHASTPTTVANQVTFPSNSTSASIGGLNTSNTHTFSGLIYLNNNIIDFDEVSAGGTVNFTGVISNTGGIRKVGAGTVQLSAANTYTGSTRINAGTLRAGITNSIANASNIILNGGTLSTGSPIGFSDTVGTLELLANSTIALGTGIHTLTFANSSGVTWTGGTTLTITGWNGGSCSSTNGRIFFGAGSGTLTAGQLAQITFSGYAAGATLLSTGEIVPTAYLAAGPLNGVYYIPSSCYPTVASAVTALNTNGISGPVTFNVAAGHTETAPAGGYSLTATGTLANPIIFQKNGVGANPTLTAPVQSTGILTDAIFKIIGGDYITIDGFTMQERSFSPSGTDTTPGTNTMTEFGVAMLVVISANNGARNNTIQNCIITLNKTYTNTFGIYSSTNHHSTAVGTTANTSNLTGANSNNKIYKNTISNVNIGIAMVGTNGFEDSGNDIGGASAATGNTITDQGNTTVASSFLGLPGTSSIGIIVAANTGSNISYNSITGNATPVNTYGIYLRSTSAPATIHTSTISYNTIQVSCSSNNTSYNLIGILNDMGGSNHTLNITNNTIQNSTTTNSSFGGAFAGIWSSATGLFIGNYNNNTISNNTITGSSLPTSAAARSALIKVSSTPITTNINGNTCNSNLFTNTGSGDIVAFDVHGNYTGACTISNNTVGVLLPVSLVGISTTGTGSITGYHNTGTPSGALTVSGNSFRNITVSTASSGSWIRFVHSNTGSSQVLNINTNVIENLTVNTAVASSGITGINTGISSNVSIYNNTITNLSCLSTIYGIRTSGGSGPHNVYGNTIKTLIGNATGGIEYYGIEVSPSTGIANLYNNKVYDMSTSGSATFMYGLSIGSATTANVYNNMVGDLKMTTVSQATALALRGITIRNATTANVYNNSVYMRGTSSGAHFSSAAFSFSGTATTDIRNNIFVNECVPKGDGYSAAIMRLATGTNGTVPTNYASTSNNNCLFAPSVTNGVIYVEGQYTTGGPTNVFQANCYDIAAFKTFVSTRETATFSEIPPFANITPGSMDLYFTASPTSACINGGQTIALTNTDIDGIARPIGAAYEIGADEVTGTTADRVPPTITYTPLSDLGCASTTVLTATITDANTLGSGATAPRLYFKKSTDVVNTIATVNNNSVGGWKFVVSPTGASPYSFTFDYTLLPGGLVTGDIIQYFVAAQDISGNVATTSATVQPCATTVAFTSAQTVSSPPTINQFTYRASYSGAYTVGTAGNFTTLTGTGGLFDAINKGYVSGDITATIISDINENGVVALNEWTEFNTGTCLPTGTTVYRLTVQSDGNVRTVAASNLVYSSSAPTLFSMINLNGADRVTFTGGTGTQRNLVFRSTNTTATSCVPVFQMGNVNGSNGIIIKNCDIQTNGMSGVAPLSSCIYITGTGTNNNNLFEFNDIHDATAGTTGNPRHGIYAENNANTVLQIQDNKFYNINTGPIQIGVGTTPTIGNGQTITRNSIYSTGLGTTNVTFSAIDVRGTASHSHTITDNIIGGGNATGTGTAFTSSTITTFRGIYIPYLATTSTTNITGNAITNVNLTTTTGAAFSGIDFTGLVNCNNNTVGHASNSALGITIGAVSATASTNNFGILGGFGTAVAGINFTNNIVKFITHRTSGTTVTSSRLVGIYNYYTGAAVTINMNNNIVSDMTSNMKNTVNLYTTGNAFSTGGILCGILSGTVSTASININNNTIFNLSNTGVNSTNTPNVIGIAVDGNTPSNVAGNRIYGLTNQSPGSAANPASIMGIRFQPSTSVVNNNMITLNNGANTNASRIIGIFDGANNLNVYFNSVIIGGSQSAFGTTGICSAPYASIISGGTHNIRNNIFLNTRTTTAGSPSGVNFHYALAQTVALSGATYTSNYNDLVAADTNRLCLYNTTSYTLAGWRALTTPSTPDVNSVAITPTFTDSANADLHIVRDSNCLFDNLGIAISGFTTDYDVETRAATPDIGADEFIENHDLIITNPATVACGATADLTLPAITVGSTTGSTLSYWIDATAITTPLTTPSAVTTGGTYYIKSIKGTCTEIDPVTVTKKSVTWNGTSWVGSGGWGNVAPDATVDLTIAGNLSSTSDITCCSCNITSGNTVINNPHTLYIVNGLTVAALPTSFTVKDKASLVQENDLATNSGNMTMERTTPNIYRFDYTYWGSPVDLASGFTLGGSTGLSPDTPTDRLYTWTPTIANGIGNWNAVTASTVMVPGLGYIVRGPSTYSFDPSLSIPFTGIIKGKPTNGVVNCPIYHGTLGALDSRDSWNLIANPYASAVDAEKFLGDTFNKTVLDGTIYFWTHNSPPLVSYPDPFYGDFVVNYNPDDYAMWNRVGGTGTTAAAGSGGSIPTGFIAAGQAFFAKSTDGVASGTNAIFNNSMRASGNNNQFFRTNSTHSNVDNTTIEKHRIWLNMISESGLFSQILIGYLTDATLDWDRDYDGERFSVSGSYLYSIIPNKTLGIQGRPLPFSDTDRVPLGYKSNGNNILSIRISDVDGLFENQNIYLEDMYLNTIHNLKNAPYNFVTQAGTFDNRFVLRYTNETLGNGEINQNNVFATISNHQLSIQANLGIKKVDLFDLSGKLIQSYSPSNIENIFTEKFDYANGVYLVKITLTNDLIVSKKLIH